MSTLSKLQQEIVEALPEIKELKFGCNVRPFMGEWGDGVILAEIGICRKHKLMKNCEDCYSEGHVDGGYKIMVSNDDGLSLYQFTEAEMAKVEILGRDITLADVLRVIYKSNPTTWYAVDDEGCFWRQEKNCETESCNGKCWDLSKPLHLQSAECHEFLLALIDTK